MRSRTLAALLTMAGALALSRPVCAQVSVGEDVSRYDALYGKPVDVAVDDLVQESVSYTNRAVRTHGRLELSFETTQRSYLLRGLLYQIRIAPVREVATEWEQESLLDRAALACCTRDRLDVYGFCQLHEKFPPQGALTKQDAPRPIARMGHTHFKLRRL